MQELITQGWAPKQAADAVLRHRRSQVSAFDALEAAHAGLPAPEAVIEAARDLDEARLADILDIAFTRGSFEHTFEAWLTPALHLVGTEWHAGRLDIAAEHMVSAAVMRRLSALYEASGAATASPTVITGLPQNGQHVIPALAFAVAARRAGLTTLYLGANVPAEAWATAARKTSVRAVVLTVTTTSDAHAASDAITAIRAARPDVLACVGGSTADDVTGADLVFTDSIPASAKTLALHLLSPSARK